MIIRACTNSELETEEGGQTTVPSRTLPEEQPEQLTVPSPSTKVTLKQVARYVYIRTLCHDKLRQLLCPLFQRLQHRMGT